MAWYNGKHSRHMTKNEVVDALEKTQKEVSSLTQELNKAQIELENARKELQQEKSINESMSTSAMILILVAAANSTKAWNTFLDKIKKELESQYRQHVQTIVDSAIEKHMDEYRHEFIEPYCGY